MAEGFKALCTYLTGKFDIKVLRTTFTAGFQHRALISAPAEDPTLKKLAASRIMQFPAQAGQIIQVVVSVDLWPECGRCRATHPEEYTCAPIAYTVKAKAPSQEEASGQTPDPAQRRSVSVSRRSQSKQSGRKRAHVEPQGEPEVDSEQQPMEEGLLFTS